MLLLELLLVVVLLVSGITVEVKRPTNGSDDPPGLNLDRAVGLKFKFTGSGLKMWMKMEGSRLTRQIIV